MTAKPRQRYMPEDKNTCVYKVWKVVDSKPFEIFIMATIVLNAIVLMVSVRISKNATMFWVIPVTDVRWPGWLVRNIGMKAQEGKQILREETIEQTRGKISNASENRTHIILATLSTVKFLQQSWRQLFHSGLCFPRKFPVSQQRFAYSHEREFCVISGKKLSHVVIIVHIWFFFSTLGSDWEHSS